MAVQVFKARQQIALDVGGRAAAQDRRVVASPVEDWRVACNRFGEILSPADGYLLMPLYQKKGDDGFFLLEEESSLAPRAAAMA